MISVKEAKSLIQEHIVPMPLHPMPLALAAGFTLGKDIYAKIDIPAYEQSSMDGYAIRYDERSLPLTISGEMQAGAEEQFTLLPEHAARIFTGAPLPQGADTVVMQEKVEVNNGVLTVLDEQLSPGIHVRQKGAEAAAGALAMQKGSKLTPAALGFLAGIGVTEVEVCLHPSVAIIVTGKELQTPGEELAFGQVYESNSYSLAAALELAQVTKINFYSADDDLNELTVVLKEALSMNDVVLLTGGVSVGDYDFVLSASRATGVRQIFHKIRQKPGKPLFFGKTDKHVVFGLPGNPSSVLSCFYQYVLPALEKMMDYRSGLLEEGQFTGSLKTREAVLTHEYTKGAGLTHFLKANFNDGNVTPLSAQESFRMSSFAQANCMIELPEGETEFPAGSVVKVYIFPE
jgi:molybdopterin molybdotransferase